MLLLNLQAQSPAGVCLAAGPAAVTCLPCAAVRTVASWEVWTGCSSLPCLVPQVPSRISSRKDLRILWGEANAGRPAPGEGDRLRSQVRSAGASPLSPHSVSPTPPLCLPRSPPRGPRLGGSFFPGHPSRSLTLCRPLFGVILSLRPLCYVLVIPGATVTKYHRPRLNSTGV